MRAPAGGGERHLTLAAAPIEHAVILGDRARLGETLRRGAGKALGAGGRRVIPRGRRRHAPRARERGGNLLVEALAHLCDAEPQQAAAR